MLLENLSDEKLWQLSQETAKQFLQTHSELENLKKLQYEIAQEQIRRERKKTEEFLQRQADHPGEFYEQNIAALENRVGWSK